MAKNLGQAFPSESEGMFTELKSARERVFKDYLESHVAAGLVSTFFAQATNSQSENQAVRERTEKHSRRTMLAGFYSTAAGCATVLMLSGLVLAALFATFFRWMRASGECSGSWPNKPRFWVASACVVLAGAGVLTNSLLSLGTGNTVGLVLSEPAPTLPLPLQTVLVSLCISGVIFAMLLCLWKFSRKPLLLRSAVLIMSLAYLAAVFATAYFRSEAVQSIASGLF
jgi:hypothetical protein